MCVYFPLHPNNIPEYVKVSMVYKYFEIKAQGSEKSQTKSYKFMGKKSLLMIMTSGQFININSLDKSTECPLYAKDSAGFQR